MNVIIYHRSKMLQTISSPIPRKCQVSNGLGQLEHEGCQRNDMHRVKSQGGPATLSGWAELAAPPRDTFTMGDGSLILPVLKNIPPPLGVSWANSSCDSRFHNEVSCYHKMG